MSKADQWRRRSARRSRVANDDGTGEVLSFPSKEQISAAVAEWIRSQVIDAETALGGPPTNAHIWAYRREGMEFLSCDLSDGGDRVLPITIVIAGTLTLYPGDPDVVDAVSAVQLAGELLAHWSLTAKIGR